MSPDEIRLAFDVATLLLQLFLFGFVAGTVAGIARDFRDRPKPP